MSTIPRPQSDDTVERVRAFNRSWTEVLGLLDRHLLDTDHTLTEARILFELGRAKRGLERLELRDKLEIDQSFLGRVLTGLQRAGLVTVARDKAPLVAAPGKRFRYSNPGMAMLAYAVTAAYRGAPGTDHRTLLTKRVMDPIGVPPAEWSIGYGQTYRVGGLDLVASWGGGSYTARAVARIGEAFGMRVLKAAVPGSPSKAPRTPLAEALAQPLAAGDGAAAKDASTLDIIAAADGTEFLLFDLP